MAEELVQGEGMRSLILACARNFNSWRQKTSYCHRRSHNVDGIEVGRSGMVQYGSYGFAFDSNAKPKIPDCR